MATATAIGTAALRAILVQRGLPPTAEQQRRIVACTDAATLDRWVDRSLSVSSVAELLVTTTTAGHRRIHRTARRGRGKAR